MQTEESKNGVYQYLDDLGTQEFINVVTEIAMENIDSSIVNHVDETVPDNKLISSSASLSLITQLNNFISELEETVSGVHADILGLQGYMGINTEAVKAGVEVLSHLKIKLITGDIDENVPEPDSSILYFQHDNEDDKSWAIYIWDGKWRVVGETKYVLINAWSKDETDELIQEFKDKYIEVLTDDFIKNKAEEIFNNILAN